MNTISVVICAYNEEETISDVIEAISNCPHIDQIIVVNDGSTDTTGQIIHNLAESIDLIYINSLINHGKGYSMASGVESSTGEIIAFLDADLVNLSYVHVNNLVQPILDDKADMVMGQPERTFINARYNPFKELTGQRAVRRKQILPITKEIRLTRFGVETFINLYYQSKCLCVKSVVLNDLVHRTKFEKMKTGKAIIEFLKEGIEILSTIVKNRVLVTNSIKRQLSTKRITLR